MPMNKDAIILFKSLLTRLEHTLLRVLRII